MVRMLYGGLLQDDAARGARIADEIREDLLADGLSVYETDDSSPVESVVVLHNGSREFSKPQGYAVFGSELLEAFAGAAVATPGESPFSYMIERHREIRGVTDVDGFSRALAASAVWIGRAEMAKKVAEERRENRWSSAEEWRAAPSWSR